jgi:cytidylate kinase
VARDVLARGASLEDEAAAAAAARALDAASLEDPGLRLPGVGEQASVVARMPAVRAALLAFQRAFAAQAPGAVLDGRDIGTVVCPDADVKIFVTADLAVRARRRFDELSGRGERVTLDGVSEVIRRRDQRDMSRADAPLKPAADAVVLDTSAMGIEEALAAALRIIAERCDQGGPGR